mgnify:CR=1 FL=1
MIAPNGTVVEGPAASEQLQSQAVTGNKKRIPRAGERALDTAGNVIGQAVTKLIGAACRVQINDRGEVISAMIDADYQLKIGDTVIDGSVKRRLEQLKEQVRRG